MKKRVVCTARSIRQGLPGTVVHAARTDTGVVHRAPGLTIEWTHRQV